MASLVSVASATFWVFGCLGEEVICEGGDSGGVGEFGEQVSQASGRLGDVPGWFLLRGAGVRLTVDAWGRQAHAVEHFAPFELCAAVDAFFFFGGEHSGRHESVTVCELKKFPPHGPALPVALPV